MYICSQIVYSESRPLTWTHTLGDVHTIHLLHYWWCVAQSHAMI